MQRFLRIFILVLILCLAVPTKVGAFPPLPSSLYGTIKLDGEDVPDGTLIQALINDQVYASVSTQTYQGDSVYAIDVPGDDTSTQEVEGGVEGDVIYFKLNGLLVDQTATWHSGTNQELDLSAISQAATAVLQTATPTTRPAGQDPENPTATNQPQPTSAPGEATSEPTSADQAGGIEQPPAGETTATFGPGVVEIVDESYPPTATPEPGAPGGAEASGPESPAGGAEEAAGTISIYWILIPIFFLLVWLYGLWYFKRKNKASEKN